MWDQVTPSDWVAYTTLTLDLGRSRFQLTDNKPVGKQPHKKNHRAERETWNIRPAPLDQKSDCEWCDDAREVAGEIFSSGPCPDLFGWRTALKNCEQVPRGKPHQGGSNQQPDSHLSIGNTCGSDEQQAHKETHRHDSFPSLRFIPAPADQPVGDPSSDRLDDAESEEREALIKLGQYAKIIQASRAWL